jgi:hypothetical protein
MKKLIFLIIILFSYNITIQAQSDETQPNIITLSDTAQISLLTSTPWDGAIYAMFGHTAIRVKDEANNLDIVFNYGIFNFNAPNFILRFIKGETDYMVDYENLDRYLREYERRKVGVIEQVFNLTQKEKQDIFNFLVINSLPENKIYRYNYFYDNCSTRPRDIIEKQIEGTIQYTPTNKEQTYRDLVHECVGIDLWAQFGIDLVIGADADKIITDRKKDFLPMYLMRAYEGAIIQNPDDTQRNLLSETNDIFTASPFIEKSSISPLLAGIILLVFIALVSWLSYKKRVFVLGKIFDTILFLVAGAGGCIIFFLMFFSEHPCTNPNWNIVWLNPLQLVVAFLFFVKSLSKYIYYYHFINFVALLAFLLAWCLIPQQLEIAFIPYILTLTLRSGMNILQQKKLKKRADYSLPKTR